MPDLGSPASTDDLLRRVGARGGELRLLGSVVQFRPAWTLTAGERRWLERHGHAVVAALTPPDRGDTAVFRTWLEGQLAVTLVPIGDAGPGCPAWFIRVRGRPMTRPASRGSDVRRELVGHDR